MCLLHYQRTRRGSPLTAPLQRRSENPHPGATECQIMECGRPVAALGMCWGHYRRQLRGKSVYVLLGGTGKKVSALKFGPPCPPYRVRREARLQLDLRTLVTFEPNTGCHLWLGDVLPTGYGQIGHWRDPWAATRIAPSCTSRA
jgi:hypothetical protein